MYQIKIDELTGSAIKSLLIEHQKRMEETSPPESRHVLDIKALQQSNITFWSMWDATKLLGCVALKELSNSMGEIKSMKIVPHFTCKGIGSQLLEFVIKQAKERGYTQLNLETGSMAYFKPARNLYRKYGFVTCEPFADYRKDGNNVFFQLNLQ